MKQFVLTIVVLLFTAMVNAYELGEFVLIDDVPSIVIHVDSTGEHGMVMSITACTDVREAQKLFRTFNWKRLNESNQKIPGVKLPKFFTGFEDAYLSLSICDNIRHENMILKIRDKLVLLRNKTTEFGKENAKVIADFCEEQGIDMSVYFPDQAWAQSLGEGWFIPGNAELELYAQFLNQPIGKSHGLNMRQNIFWWMNHELRHLMRYDASGSLGSISNNVYIHFFVPFSIKSSTMVISPWTISEENMNKTIGIDEKEYNLCINHKKRTYYDDFFALSTFYFGESYYDRTIYLSYHLANTKVAAKQYGEQQQSIVAVKEF